MKRRLSGGEMSPSKRREGGNAGPSGGGGAPGGRTMSVDKIKDLEARPYQVNTC